MQWTIFATMFDNIGPPVVGAVNGIVAALQGWMRPILLAAVPLSVMLRMIWQSLKGTQINPLNEAIADAITGSVVVYMATEAAGFGPQARDLILNGLSTEIGRVVIGTLGARPVSGMLFDDIWNRTFVAGLTVLRSLPWSPSGLGLAFVVVIYWVVGIGAIALAFFIWLSSFVMLALLVGLWPLGVGFFAFPWLRGPAWGWVNTVLANLLLQVSTVVLLSIALGALGRILQQLSATTPAGTLPNEIAQIQMVLGAGAIVFFLGWLAKQLPGQAATWAHGFTGFGQVPRFSWPFGSSASAADAVKGGPDSQTVQPQGGHAVTSPAPAAVPVSAPPGRALG